MNLPIKVNTFFNRNSRLKIANFAEVCLQDCNSFASLWLLSVSSCGLANVLQCAVGLSMWRFSFCFQIRLQAIPGAVLTLLLTVAISAVWHFEAQPFHVGNKIK
jgi:hypothetical protein